MTQPHIQRGIEVLRDAQHIADQLAKSNGTSRDKVMVPIKVIDVAVELLTGGGEGPADSVG